MSHIFEELGCIAEFINGAAFKPEDWGDEGRRIIRIQNLTDPCKPYNRTNREVSDRLHVHPGDLLVSWSATLGVFEWSGPDVAVLNQHIFRVVPNKSRVDKRFLRHALEGALSAMQKHLHGATMQHVNRGEFLSTKLFLPGLAEQRRIAEVLDRAEALRAKRRAALAQLGSLTQSLFLELFGDPKGNPKNWPMRSFAETMRDETSRSEKLQQSNYAEAGSYPVVDQGQSEIAGFCDDESMVCVSELPVVVFGDHTRAVKLVVEEFVVGADGAKVLVPQPNTDATFLASLLRMVPIPNLGYSRHMREVKRLSYIAPPLHLQREFARRVAAVEKLKSAHRASLAELDSLFASLQHRAFRGEL
ncbi:MAG: restriction endonuclease subunit S [Verrucomicrobia bacterium]|nr:restriction endonuclease subunit S [Verrucomicrobiota bacterium]